MTAKAQATKTQETKATTISAAKKPVHNQMVEDFYTPFYFLQRAMGNQTVQQWTRIGIQRKIKIGAVNDMYEREADRVAEQIIRMPEPTIQTRPPCSFAQSSSCADKDSVQTKALPFAITLLIQKKEDEEYEVQRQPEEEKETMQSKPLSEKITPVIYGQLGSLEQTTLPGTQSTVSPALQHRINALQGSGQPLSQAERDFFEPRFGVDFSQVQIHANQRERETARAISARAFTIENNIVFGEGQYRPGLTEGKHLFAHELTRVVRQTRANSSNMLQRETSASVRPWQEVNAQFADRSGHQIRLFSHDFGASTSLTSALQWIFDNATARPTSFQFVSERETIGTTVDEAYLQSIGQPIDWYQEVTLVWLLRRRRFVAYTTRQTTSSAADPRQGHILVAHTHPTQRQVPGGGGSLGVSWQTMTPSSNDSRNFHPRQTVSIICHRDPIDNRTPVAFVYDRSGQVLARYRGAGAFQSAADDFHGRERSAGSPGRSVGHYSAGG